MPPRVSAATASLTSSSVKSLQLASTHCSSCLRRSFSSSPASQTRLRRLMFAWLQGPGENFRHPLVGSTNYLSAYDRRGNLLRGGDTSQKSGPDTEDSKALDAAAEGSALAKETQDDLKPFPLNKHFTSQSVLSEDLRQEIWTRVHKLGKSVRQVSVELGVDMRRVAAVVRLVEVEKRMRAEGKPLALPYARAVLAMVPTTPYSPKSKPTPHEPINDLEQHPLTKVQVFYPTSESRAFNRTDAGRAFSGAPRLSDQDDIAQGGKPAQEPWQDKRTEIIGKPGHEHAVLKPADSRIPHPHLIAFEKDKLDASISPEQRRARYNARLAEDEAERLKEKERALARKEQNTRRVETDRWQFVVTEVMATRQGTGLDGRGTKAPGMRYGVPSQERKRGQVKIPTRVEV